METENHTEHETENQNETVTENSKYFKDFIKIEYEDYDIVQIIPEAIIVDNSNILGNIELDKFLVFNNGCENNEKNINLQPEVPKNVCNQKIKQKRSHVPLTPSERKRMAALKARIKLENMTEEEHEARRAKKREYKRRYRAKMLEKQKKEENDDSGIKIEEANSNQSVSDKNEEIFDINEEVPDRKEILKAYIAYELSLKLKNMSEEDKITNAKTRAKLNRRIHSCEKLEKEKKSLKHLTAEMGNFLTFRKSKLGSMVDKYNLTDDECEATNTVINKKLLGIISEAGESENGENDSTMEVTVINNELGIVNQDDITEDNEARENGVGESLVSNVDNELVIIEYNTTDDEAIKDSNTETDLNNKLKTIINQDTLTKNSCESKVKNVENSKDTINTLDNSKEVKQIPKYVTSSETCAEIVTGKHGKHSVQFRKNNNLKAAMFKKIIKTCSDNKFEIIKQKPKIINGYYTKELKRINGNLEVNFKKKWGDFDAYRRRNMRLKTNIYSLNKKSEEISKEKIKNINNTNFKQFKTTSNSAEISTDD